MARRSSPSPASRTALRDLRRAVERLPHYVRPIGDTLLAAARVDPGSVRPLVLTLARVLKPPPGGTLDRRAAMEAPQIVQARQILGLSATQVDPVPILQGDPDGVTPYGWRLEGDEGGGVYPGDTQKRPGRGMPGKVSTPSATEGLSPWNPWMSLDVIQGMSAREVWPAWHRAHCIQEYRGKDRLSKRLHRFTVQAGTGGEPVSGVAWEGMLDPRELSTWRYVAPKQAERHELRWKLRPNAAQAARLKRLKREGWTGPRRVRVRGARGRPWVYEWAGVGVGCEVRGMGLVMREHSRPDFLRNRQIAEGRLLAVCIEGATVLTSGSPREQKDWLRRHPGADVEQLKSRACRFGVDTSRPRYLESLLELADLK